MRLIPACILASLAVTGCSDYRDTMMVAPDRQGHAATDPERPTPQGGTTKLVAGPGEMYITLGAQDTLTSVAKAYGVTLDWLIKRNRLTDPPKPGDNLIVPQR